MECTLQCYLMRRVASISYVMWGFGGFHVCTLLQSQSLTLSETWQAQDCRRVPSQTVLQNMSGTWSEFLVRI
jgi:hypothetical protein